MECARRYHLARSDLRESTVLLCCTSGTTFSGLALCSFFSVAFWPWLALNPHQVYCKGANRTENQTEEEPLCMDVVYVQVLGFDSCSTTTCTLPTTPLLGTPPRRDDITRNIHIQGCILF